MQIELLASVPDKAADGFITVARLQVANSNLKRHNPNLNRDIFYILRMRIANDLDHALSAKTKDNNTCSK